MKTYNTIQEWIAAGEKINKTSLYITEEGKKQSNKKPHDNEWTTFKEMFGICKSVSDYITISNDIIDDIKTGKTDGQYFLGIHLHGFLLAACVHCLEGKSLKTFKDDIQEYNRLYRNNPGVKTIGDVNIDKLNNLNIRLSYLKD